MGTDRPDSVELPPAPGPVLIAGVILDPLTGSKHVTAMPGVNPIFEFLEALAQIEYGRQLEAASKPQILKASGPLPKVREK